MAQSAIKKNDRIDFRVSSIHKEKLNTAASLNHLNLSDYIISKLMPIVENDLKNQEKIVLEEKAWDNFVSMLETPKAPTEKSVSAMKAYLKSKER